MRLGPRRRGLLLCGCGLAAFALGAAACGGGGSKTSSGTSASTAASTTSGAGAGATGSAATAAGTGTVVTVGESEFKLALSTNSFHPGTYTIHTVNNGHIVHSLEILGPGVDAKTPNLNPGQSADLQVSLQDGSYDFFCPIPGHKSLGMNAEVTIGAAAASTGATSAPNPTVPASTSGGGGVSY